MPDAHPITGLMPLQTTRLTYAVRGKQLIHNLNLQLAAGPLTVIMGPNGAGKSLLLRLLHGLIAPTKGQINWGGQHNTRAVRLRQAMVFQRPVLLRRSVRANLQFAIQQAQHHGNGTIDADRLLEQVGLLDNQASPARRLSGGEQQRLAMARAMALSPDVLLLDEPTASLDPVSVQIIESLVRDTHSAGTKVIFVTHDIGQAKRLADEIVFMDNGGVVEHRPAGEFFQQPQTDAASAYLEGRLFVPRRQSNHGEPLQ